jgi:glycosyltransferase involved in cell wall biosynthesis
MKMPARRVLIVCAGYPPDIKGGGEKSTQILAQSLSAQGNVVRVLTLADTSGERIDTDQVTRIEMQRSPNIYWNFRRHTSTLQKVVWHALDNFNPRAIDAVTRCIETFRPDIVVSSTIENFGPSIWQASAKAGIPVVHILRSYYVQCLRGTMFCHGRNCKSACIECSALTWGRRHAAPLVNGLVGISRFILDQHSDLFPKAKQIVIPNAVHPVAALHPQRTHSSPVTFGYLGRLEPEKGVREILETFRQLPDYCHLLVAGTGHEAYEAALKAQFASPRIRFLGWVSADAVYRDIDFAVIPSLWNEPFGRVVIEAYSQGVPVIAAARGGLSELVNLRTGYLFDPDVSGDLHAVCLRAAHNMQSYDQMVQAARSEAQRYSPPALAQQYDQFFTDLLHG